MDSVPKRKETRDLKVVDYSPWESVVKKVLVESDLGHLGYWTHHRQGSDLNLKKGLVSV